MGKFYAHDDFSSKVITKNNFICNKSLFTNHTIILTKWKCKISNNLRTTKDFEMKLRMFSITFKQLLLLEKAKI